MVTTVAGTQRSSATLMRTLVEPKTEAMLTVPDVSQAAGGSSSTLGGGGGGGEGGG